MDKPAPSANNKYYEVERFDNFGNFFQDRFFANLGFFVHAKWHEPAKHIDFICYKVATDKNKINRDLIKGKYKGELLVRVNSDMKMMIRSIDTFFILNYKQEMDNLSPLLVKILEWSLKLID